MYFLTKINTKYIRIETVKGDYSNICRNNSFYFFIIKRKVNHVGSIKDYLAFKKKDIR